jgi:TolB-like protein/tetratricopeptide (TPR) repeat protein
VNRTNENTVSEHTIRQELTRILQSPIFAQSDRLGRFLRFTVEHAISGKDEGLKEYVIGTEVYDRKPPYHPSQDSIVRTEARRLRTKLKEYYESEGKDDPIFIYFRPGSYIPVFRSKDSAGSYQVVAGSSGDELFIEGAGVPIAVIPFLDVSGQPLSAKYARGVTDELVHELMQCEGCRVIAASSIAQLGSQVSDIPALARKLGVQVVFEGTVREEGNRIRVTSRIVSADGFQLWSQRFDAEADSSSLFAVQEQFASALVNRVRPQQSIIRAAEASAGPVVLAIYPAILKAEALLEEGTASDIQAALAKFREVAQSAPGYARPHCGIAQCYCWMTLHGAARSVDLVSLARVAAERAMELDPEMIECLAAMGSVLTLEWNWSGAEASFQRATELRSHAASDRQYAMLLTILGRFDEAWLYLESAQQIDPFSYLQKVACAKFFYLSRRYEEALEHFSEPLRFGPLPLEVQLYQALIHAQLGQHDDAKKIARLVQRSAGAQLSLRGWIAEILARCGETAAAAAIVDEFHLLSPAASLSRFRQALLAIALEDHEGALSSLSASYADREAELPWLAVDPRFDLIRGTPQFGEIVTKVRSGVSS